MRTLVGLLTVLLLQTAQGGNPSHDTKSEDRTAYGLEEMSREFSAFLTKRVDTPEEKAKTHGDLRAQIQRQEPRSTAKVDLFDDEKKFVEQGLKIIETLKGSRDLTLSKLSRMYTYGDLRPFREARYSNGNVECEVLAYWDPSTEILYFEPSALKDDPWGLLSAIYSEGINAVVKNGMKNEDWLVTVFGHCLLNQLPHRSAEFNKMAQELLEKRRST